MAESNEPKVDASDTKFGQIVDEKGNELDASTIEEVKAQFANIEGKLQLLKNQDEKEKYDKILQLKRADLNELLVKNEAAKKNLEEDIKKIEMDEKLIQLKVSLVEKEKTKGDLIKNNETEKNVLEAKIKNLNKEIEKVELEKFDVLSSQVQSLQNDLDDKKKQKSSEKSDLEKTLANLQLEEKSLSQPSELLQLIENSKKNIESLTQKASSEKEKLQKEFDVLKLKENELSNPNHDSINSDIEAVKKRIKENQDRFNSDKISLENKLSDLKKEETKLGWSTLKENSIELTKQISEAEERISKAKANLNEEKEKGKRLEELKKDEAEKERLLSEQIGSIQKQIDELKKSSSTSIAVLQKKLATSLEEEQALKNSSASEQILKEISSSEEKVKGLKQALEEEKKTQETKLSSLKKEEESLKNCPAVFELNSKIRELQGNILKLKESSILEEKALKQSVNLLKQEEDSVKESNRNLLQEMTRLKESIQESKAETQKEKLSLEAKLSSLELEHDTLSKRSELVALQNHLVNLSESVSRLKDSQSKELSKLQDGLDERQKEIEAVQTKFEEASNLVFKLGGEVRGDSRRGSKSSSPDKRNAQLEEDQLPTTSKKVITDVFDQSGLGDQPWNQHQNNSVDRNLFPGLTSVKELTPEILRIVMFFLDTTTKFMNSLLIMFSNVKLNINYRSDFKTVLSEHTQRLEEYYKLKDSFDSEPMTTSNLKSLIGIIQKEQISQEKIFSVVRHAKIEGVENTANPDHKHNKSINKLLITVSRRMKVRRGWR